MMAIEVDLNHQTGNLIDVLRTANQIVGLADIDKSFDIICKSYATKALFRISTKFDHDDAVCANNLATLRISIATIVKIITVVALTV